MYKIGLLRSVFGFIVVLASLPASAAYNANIAGVPTKIITGENGAVFFAISTQPASHPACNHIYFAIDNGLPATTVSQNLARLLAAYATGETINIGYDNAGSCVYGYMHAYQIG